MTLETLTVPSKSRKNVAHTLYIRDNRAIGCTCEQRCYQTFKPCKHMTAYNAQIEQSAKDVERTHYLNFELGMGI